VGIPRAEAVLRVYDDPVDEPGLDRPQQALEIGALGRQVEAACVPEDEAVRQPVPGGPAMNRFVLSRSLPLVAAGPDVRDTTRAARYGWPVHCLTSVIVDEDPDERGRTGIMTGFTPRPAPANSPAEVETT